MVSLCFQPFCFGGFAGFSDFGGFGRFPGFDRFGGFIMLFWDSVHAQFVYHSRRVGRGVRWCARSPPPQAAEVYFFVDQRFGRLEFGTLLKNHDDQHC